MLFELKARILAVDSTEFGIWVALAVAAALAGLYFFMRGLSRARLIEDTPTARIRSAPQGYVELTGSGRLMDGPPIVAALTGRHCLWYEYRIERREHTGSRNRSTRWRTVESGRSDGLFLIEDDTGQCVIDPDGAEVITTGRDTWFGDTAWPSTGPAVSRSFGSGFLSLSFGSYRYTERRLNTLDDLYAIGEFRTLGTDHTGDHRQDVVAILRAWKKSPEHYLRKFDKNEDGKIDLQEWEDVRKAAEQEALTQRAKRSVSGVINLLSKGRSGRPFILSATPQDGLAVRYRVIAWTGLGAFFLAGGGAVWAVLVRLAAGS
jgi:hypothetical protein